MRKLMLVAIATVLLFGLLSATASAQNLVCWELQHGLLGIQPIELKVSALDMGNGNYTLVGSAFTTTVTDPPATIRRVITGGAVVMESNKIEVSLSATDISDRPATTAEEGLAVIDYHMLLDGALNGTFHSSILHFAASADPETTPLTGSTSGNVVLVDCN